MSWQPCPQRWQHGEWQQTFVVQRRLEQLDMGTVEHWYYAETHAGLPCDLLGSSC